MCRPLKDSMIAFFLLENPPKSKGFSISSEPLSCLERRKDKEFKSKTARNPKKKGKEDQGVSREPFRA